jgi:hypothetical protein
VRCRRPVLRGGLKERRPLSPHRHEPTTWGSASPITVSEAYQSYRLAPIRTEQRAVKRRRRVDQDRHCFALIESAESKGSGLAPALIEGWPRLRGSEGLGLNPGLQLRRSLLRPNRMPQCELCSSQGIRCPYEFCRSLDRSPLEATADNVAASRLYLLERNPTLLEVFMCTHTLPVRPCTTAQRGTAR